MVEEIELKEGLTSRVLLAILYSAIVLTPVSIYTQLVTPTQISPIIILILMVELARVLGNPLTTQEAFLIYFLSGTAMTATLWINMVFRAYMVKSPFFEFLGFTQEVPPWWAPPPGSRIYEIRTLLSPEWLVPISIAITFTVLSLAAEIALSYLLAQLYIEVEKLPFPVAQYQAEVIKNLTEREPARFRVFTLSALVGLAYGLLLYGVPSLSQAMFGVSLYVPGLQLPWNDLTEYIEKIMPGAAIGLAPDILTLTTAWVIPRHVILAIAITSTVIYVFGNHIALTAPFELFKLWQRDWYPGAGVTMIVQKSFMDIWLSPYIGVNIVAGVVPLIIYRRAYYQAFRNLRSLPEALRKRGYLPLNFLISIYLVCSLASLVIIMMLVPGFPWYLLLPFVAWEFIYAFVAGWGVGTVGLAVIEPPYMREATILVSGYRDLDIWFAPWIIAPGRNAALLLNNAFRVGYWCGCKPSSYFKGLIIATAASLTLGLVYTDMFWRIAPIPSAAYPWAAFLWPINAIRWTFFPSLVVRGGGYMVFNPEMILAGLAAGAAVFAIIVVAKLPASTFMGVVAGMVMAPPIALSLLIGLAVSFLAERFVGKDWWATYRADIIAGIAVGEGVIIAIGGAFMLIAKSIWILPY